MTEKVAQQPVAPKLGGNNSIEPQQQVSHEALPNLSDMPDGTAGIYPLDELEDDKGQASVWPQDKSSLVDAEAKLQHSMALPEQVERLKIN